MEKSEKLENDSLVLADFRKLHILYNKELEKRHYNNCFFFLYSDTTSPKSFYYSYSNIYNE